MSTLDRIRAQRADPYADLRVSDPVLAEQHRREGLAGTTRTRSRFKTIEPTHADPRLTYDAARRTPS